MPVQEFRHTSKAHAMRLLVNFGKDKRKGRCEDYLKQWTKVNAVTVAPNLKLN